MKIKDIIHDSDYLREKGYGAENNIVRYVDVNTIAHFGNCACLEIVCENICPYSTCNNTGNLGFLIRGLIELLELSEEDGIRLSEIKDIPCRLVFPSGGDTHLGERAIGIGHFIKNKFIMFDEFGKLDDQEKG